MTSDIQHENQQQQQSPTSTPSPTPMTYAERMEIMLAKHPSRNYRHAPTYHLVLQKEFEPPMPPEDNQPSTPPEQPQPPMTQIERLRRETAAYHVEQERLANERAEQARIKAEQQAEKLKYLTENPPEEVYVDKLRRETAAHNEQQKILDAQQAEMRRQEAARRKQEEADRQARADAHREWALSQPTHVRYTEQLKQETIEHNDEQKFWDAIAQLKRQPELDRKANLNAWLDENKHIIGPKAASLIRKLDQKQALDEMFRYVHKAYSNDPKYADELETNSDAVRLLREYGFNVFERRPEKTKREATNPNYTKTEHDSWKRTDEKRKLETLTGEDVNYRVSQLPANMSASWQTKGYEEQRARMERLWRQVQMVKRLQTGSISSVEAALDTPEAHEALTQNQLLPSNLLILLKLEQDFQQKRINADTLKRRVMAFLGRKTEGDESQWDGRTLSDNLSWEQHGTHVEFIQKQQAAQPEINATIDKMARIAGISEEQRKKLIPGLTYEQHAFVTSDANKQVQIGGPGGGKTYELALRLAYLKQKGVPIEQGIYTGATHGAVKVLRQRLAAYAGLMIDPNDRTSGPIDWNHKDFDKKFTTPYALAMRYLYGRNIFTIDKKTGETIEVSPMSQMDRYKGYRPLGEESLNANRASDLGDLYGGNNVDLGEAQSNYLLQVMDRFGGKKLSLTKVIEHINKIKGQQSFGSAYNDELAKGKMEFAQGHGRITGLSSAFYAYEQSLHMRSERPAERYLERVLGRYGGEGLDRKELLKYIQKLDPEGETYKQALDEGEQTFKKNNEKIVDAASAFYAYTQLRQEDPSDKDTIRFGVKGQDSGRFDLMDSLYMARRAADLLGARKFAGIYGDETQDNPPEAYAMFAAMTHGGSHVIFTGDPSQKNIYDTVDQAAMARRAFSVRHHANRPIEETKLTATNRLTRWVAAFINAIASDPSMEGLPKSPYLVSTKEDWGEMPELTHFETFAQADAYAIRKHFEDTGMSWEQIRENVKHKRAPYYLESRPPGVMTPEQSPIVFMTHPRAELFGHHVRAAAIHHLGETLGQEAFERMFTLKSPSAATQGMMHALLTHQVRSNEYTNVTMDMTRMGVWEDPEAYLSQVYTMASRPTNQLRVMGARQQLGSRDWDHKPDTWGDMLLPHGGKGLVYRMVNNAVYQQNIPLEAIEPEYRDMINMQITDPKIERNGEVTPELEQIAELMQIVNLLKLIVPVTTQVNRAMLKGGFDGDLDEDGKPKIPDYMQVFRANPAAESGQLSQEVDLTKFHLLEEWLRQMWENGPEQLQQYGFEQVPGLEELFDPEKGFLSRWQSQKGPTFSKEQIAALRQSYEQQRSPQEQATLLLHSPDIAAYLQEDRQRMLNNIGIMQLNAKERLTLSPEESLPADTVIGTAGFIEDPKNGGSSPQGEARKAHFDELDKHLQFIQQQDPDYPEYQRQLNRMTQMQTQAQATSPLPFSQELPAGYLQQVQRVRALKENAYALMHYSYNPGAAAYNQQAAKLQAMQEKAEKKKSRRYKYATALPKDYLEQVQKLHTLGAQADLTHDQNLENLAAYRVQAQALEDMRQNAKISLNKTALPEGYLQQAQLVKDLRAQAPAAEAYDANLAEYRAQQQRLKDIRPGMLRPALPADGVYSSPLPEGYFEQVKRFIAARDAVSDPEASAEAYNLSLAEYQAQHQRLRQMRPPVVSVDIYGSRLPEGYLEQVQKLQAARAAISDPEATERKLQEQYKALKAQISVASTSPDEYAQQLPEGYFEQVKKLQSLRAAKADRKTIAAQRKVLRQMQTGAIRARTNVMNKYYIPNELKKYAHQLPEGYLDQVKKVQELRATNAHPAEIELQQKALHHMQTGAIRARNETLMNYNQVKQMNVLGGVIKKIASGRDKIAQLASKAATALPYVEGLKVLKRYGDEKEGLEDLGRPANPDYEEMTMEERAEQSEHNRNYRDRQKERQDYYKQLQAQEKARAEKQPHGVYYDPQVHPEDIIRANAFQIVQTPEFRQHKMGRGLLSSLLDHPTVIGRLQKHFIKEGINHPLMQLDPARVAMLQQAYKLRVAPTDKIKTINEQIRDAKARKNLSIDEAKSRNVLPASDAMIKKLYLQRGMAYYEASQEARHLENNAFRQGVSPDVSNLMHALVDPNQAGHDPALADHIWNLAAAQLTSRHLTTPNMDTMGEVVADIGRNTDMEQVSPESLLRINAMVYNNRRLQANFAPDTVAGEEDRLLDNDLTVTPEYFNLLMERDPAQAIFLRNILGDGGNGFIPLWRARREINAYTRHPARAIAMVSKADNRIDPKNPEREFYSQAERLAAPMTAHIQDIIARLTDPGDENGGAGGILDPMAGEVDKHGNFVPFGSLVTLQGYQARLRDQWGRMNALREKNDRQGLPMPSFDQMQQIANEHDRVKQFREAIIDPRNQAQFGHYMNIVGHMLYGSEPTWEGLDKDERARRSEDRQRPPVNHLFRNIRDRYAEGTYTLDSMINVFDSMYSGMRHMQRTGAIKREHIDQLVQALGHDPTDKAFKGLHILEHNSYFSHPDDAISLDALVHQFKDDPKKKRGYDLMQKVYAQFTRFPMHQGDQVTFVGEPAGKFQEGRLQEGMTGTLDAFPDLKQVQASSVARMKEPPTFLGNIKKKLTFGFTQDRRFLNTLQLLTRPFINRVEKFYGGQFFRDMPDNRPFGVPALFTTKDAEGSDVSHPILFNQVVPTEDYLRMQQGGSDRMIAPPSSHVGAAFTEEDAAAANARPAPRTRRAPARIPRGFQMQLFERIQEMRRKRMQLSGLSMRETLNARRIYLPQRGPTTNMFPEPRFRRIITQKMRETGIKAREDSHNLKAQLAHIRVHGKTVKAAIAQQQATAIAAPREFSSSSSQQSQPLAAVGADDGEPAPAASEAPSPESSAAPSAPTTRKPKRIPLRYVSLMPPPPKQRTDIPERLENNPALLYALTMFNHPDEQENIKDGAPPSVQGPLQPDGRYPFTPLFPQANGIEPYIYDQDTDRDAREQARQAAKERKRQRAQSPMQKLSPREQQAMRTMRTVAGRVHETVMGSLSRRDAQQYAASLAQRQIRQQQGQGVVSETVKEMLARATRAHQETTKQATPSQGEGQAISVEEFTRNFGTGGSTPAEATAGAKEATEQVQAIANTSGVSSSDAIAAPASADVVPMGNPTQQSMFGGPNAIAGAEGGTSVVSDASQVIENLRHEQDTGVVAGGTVTGGQSTADVKEQAQQGQQLMGQQQQGGGAEAPTEEQLRQPAPGTSAKDIETMQAYAATLQKNLKNNYVGSGYDQVSYASAEVMAENSLAHYQNYPSLTSAMLAVNAHAFFQHRQQQYGDEIDAFPEELHSYIREMEKHTPGFMQSLILPPGAQAEVKQQQQTNPQQQSGADTPTEEQRKDLKQQATPVSSKDIKDMQGYATRIQEILKDSTFSWYDKASDADVVLNADRSYKHYQSNPSLTSAMLAIHGHTFLQHRQQQRGNDIDAFPEDLHGYIREMDKHTPGFMQSLVLPPGAQVAAKQPGGEPPTQEQKEELKEQASSAAAKKHGFVPTPDDEYLEKAKAFVTSKGSVSARDLMRAFKIGDSRARNLMDLMAQHKHIAPLEHGGSWSDPRNPWKPSATKPAGTSAEEVKDLPVPDTNRFSNIPDASKQTEAAAEPEAADMLATLHSHVMHGYKNSDTDKMHPPSDEQLEVLKNPEMNRIIKGGPGGGKTTALVRATMERIASGKVLPKNVLSLSGMHSGRMALDAEHQQYDKHLPTHDENFRMKPARTYHSIAHAILFAGATQNEKTGEVFYPNLDAIDFKNFSGNILMQEDQEDLLHMNPEARLAAHHLSQEEYLRRVLKTRSFQKHIYTDINGKEHERKYNLENVDFEQMLKDIGKWKKSRGAGGGQAYAQAMDIGRKRLAKGYFSHEVGLVEYQDALKRNGDIDQDDTLYMGDQVLKTNGFNAIPEDLKNIEHIEADEAQDHTESSFSFLKSLKSALEQGGNKVSTFLGLDEMQSLMQDMGGIPLNQIMNRMKEWLGITEHHTLTKNFRSDARAVALNNAILKHRDLKNEAKGDPQVPTTGRIGEKEQFILAKTQPTLYRKMFESMLKTAGVDPKQMLENYKNSKAAFAGMEWRDNPVDPTSDRKVTPSEVPAIFTMRRQQELFAKVAKRYLQMEHGYTAKQAEDIYNEITRPDVIGKDHPDQDLYEQAKNQFSIIRTARARSLSFLFPHSDVTRGGWWILPGVEKIQGYLRNIYTSLSRVAEGGYNTIGAVNHPFSRDQYKTYMNLKDPDTEFEDQYPDNPGRGAVILDGKQMTERKGNPNGFQHYKGELVPHGFGNSNGFLAAQDKELATWISEGKITNASAPPPPQGQPLRSTEQVQPLPPSDAGNSSNSAPMPQQPNMTQATPSSPTPVPTGGTVSTATPIVQPVTWEQANEQRLSPQLQGLARMHDIAKEQRGGQPAPLPPMSPTYTPYQPPVLSAQEQQAAWEQVITHHASNVAPSSAPVQAPPVKMIRTDLEDNKKAIAQGAQFSPVVILDKDHPEVKKSGIHEVTNSDLLDQAKRSQKLFEKRGDIRKGFNSLENYGVLQQRQQAANEEVIKIPNVFADLVQHAITANPDFGKAFVQLPEPTQQRAPVPGAEPGLVPTKGYDTMRALRTNVPIGFTKQHAENLVKTLRNIHNATYKFTKLAPGSDVRNHVNHEYTYRMLRWTRAGKPADALQALRSEAIIRNIEQQEKLAPLTLEHADQLDPARQALANLHPDLAKEFGLTPAAPISPSDTAEAPPAPTSAPPPEIVPLSKADAFPPITAGTFQGQYAASKNTLGEELSSRVNAISNMVSNVEDRPKAIAENAQQMREHYQQYLKSGGDSQHLINAMSFMYATHSLQHEEKVPAGSWEPVPQRMLEAHNVFTKEYPDVVKNMPHTLAQTSSYPTPPSPQQTSSYPTPPSPQQTLPGPQEQQDIKEVVLPNSLQNKGADSSAVASSSGGRGGINGFSGTMQVGTLNVDAGTVNVTGGDGGDGGSGGGGKGGKGGEDDEEKKLTPSQRWNNNIAQFGHSLARVGSEFQFVGQLFQGMADSALKQGSEYRRATLGIAPAGAGGTGGFFDFNGIGNIDTWGHESNLSMYSNVQLAQGLKDMAAMTGTNFSREQSLGPTQDVLGLAALTGIDPTSLMAQLTTASGLVGGSPQGTLQSTGKLAGMFSNLYGNNLSSANVGPTLEALNMILPSMQGLNTAVGGNIDQTSQAMAIFKVAQDAGMSPQNMPGVSQMLGGLAQVGSNPNLQQQYQLSKLMPYISGAGSYNTMTADTELVNYNSEENNRQEQIKELQLQQNIGNGVSLPNLNIKISQAQIQMDKAQLDMSEFNQQYAQAQYGVSVFQAQYAQAQYQNAVFEHQYGQAQYQNAQFQQQYNQAQYNQAQFNQQYNQAQYQNSAFQQQYQQAQFNQSQYTQNQLYGPIGADLSKTAYFSWLQNQQAAHYNSTSPEQALNYQPAQTFGLKNEEFYSGMEHQRTQMVLGRSSLLSDMAFQENLKNIDKQEDYYKREMDLQNEQRAFDKDWKQQELDHANTMLTWQKKQVDQQGIMLEWQKKQLDQNAIMLGWQKKQLDQQGTMLSWQKKQVDLQQSMLGWQKEQLDKQAGILDIQKQQYDLESQKAMYEQNQDKLQNAYLSTQIGDLQALSTAMQQQLDGQGPVNGMTLQPEQIIQALANKHRDDKDDTGLRKDVNALLPNPADRNALYQIVKQVEQPGKDADLATIRNDLNKPGNQHLRDTLKQGAQNGAFADQQQIAGLANAMLQFAGTGENWKNLITASKSIVDNLQIIAHNTAGLSAFTETAGFSMNIFGQIVLVLASFTNLLGIFKAAKIIDLVKLLVGGGEAAGLSGIGGVAADLALPATVVGGVGYGFFGNAFNGWNNWSLQNGIDTFKQEKSENFWQSLNPFTVSSHAGTDARSFIDAFQHPEDADKIWGKGNTPIFRNIDNFFDWGGKTFTRDKNGKSGFNDWMGQVGGNWNNWWGNVNTWSDQNLRYHNPGDSSGVDPNLMVDSTSVMSDGSNPLRRRQQSSTSWTDDAHTLFTKAIPDGFMKNIWGPAGDLFNKYIITNWNQYVSKPISWFFGTWVPDAWNKYVSKPVSWLFGTWIPGVWNQSISKLDTLIHKTIPDAWNQYVSQPFDTLIHKTIPDNFNKWIGVPWGNFFNKTIPDIFNPVQIFFSKIHEYFNTYLWSPATVLFTQTIPDFFLKKLPKMVTDALAKLNPFAGTGGTPRGGTPAGHSGFTTPQVYQEFGVNNPKRGTHYGVDFAAAQGTPIGEFIGGKVKSTGHYDWGYEVDVELPNGLTERYVHLSLVGVHPGQKLKKGDFVGLSGGGTPESGLGYYSDGPHLHYQTDFGTYNNAISPWMVLAMYGDKNILPEFGGIHPRATGGRGAGGAGFYQMDGTERRAHLYQGGVAMTRMKAEIAEQEPEAVIPISKLTSILQSTFRQTTPSEPAATQSSGKAPITLTKLAEKLELHVHTTAQTLDEHAQDDLMAQLLEIVSTALREYNGKLN